jgi:hypothetical protein
MDDRIRMKHLTGKSVRDYSLEHPSDIEGHSTTVAELGQVLDRMDVVSSMFETGQREAGAANEEKERLILTIHADYLRPIAAIARGNGALDPALARRFVAPSVRRDRTAYLGAARSILALASEQKAIFIGDGMPATFVEDFGTALAAYDAAASSVNTNEQLHVQARAELKTLAGRVMRLIKRLDGINRARFLKDPHLFEAWQAARNVGWPATAAVKTANKAKKQSDPAA